MYNYLLLLGDEIGWREITSRLNKRDLLWGKADKIASRFCNIPHSSVVDAVKILPVSKIRVHNHIKIHVLYCFLHNYYFFKNDNRVI